MEHSFDFDNYTLTHTLIKKDGKRMHGLFAVKDGSEKKDGIQLFIDENFSAILKKFININKQELTQKLCLTQC